MTTISNPYVGPRTFTQAEKHLFFGREAEARDLLSLVISERLVLFYADSGSGKTSLINTRLIPMLAEENFLVLPIGRVSGELPDGIEQVNNIFAFNLMLHLDQSAATANPAKFAQLTFSQFLNNLTTPDGIFFEYDEAVDTDDTDNGDVYEEPAHILIIDQFEEIVTHHLDHWTHRADFFKQLDEALSNDPLLWIVLALREDYLAALEPYTQYLSNRLRDRFYMQRMDYQAALDAIQYPAQQASRPFAPNVAETLVNNLRQIRIQGQNKPQLGQFIEPVQLQVVCYQLWENLKTKPDSTITAQHLQELGDVDKALTSFYENALKEALAYRNVSERQLRDWFSSHLITPARTRGLVYRGEQETKGLTNAVLDRLTESFVIRTDIRGGDTWYELTHDRLVEPILEANKRWEENYYNPVAIGYQTWQASNRDSHKLLLGESLKEAQEYATNHPNEITDEEQNYLENSISKAKRIAEKQRNGRLIAAFVIAITIIGIVILSWSLNIALGEKVKAERNAQEAERNAQEAKQNAQEAERNAQEALANQLAAQSQIAPDFTSSLNLLLAREAVLKTWKPDLSTIANPFVTVQADAALQQAVNRATQLPWYRTFPWRQRHTNSVEAVAFSFDGTYIASASKDQTVRLWNTKTGQEEKRLNHHPNTVWDVAFSPDGRYLVSSSGGEDGSNPTINIWNLDTDTIITQISEQTLEGNSLGWIKTVAFSPLVTETVIATGSSDGTVRVWDIQTGIEKKRLGEGRSIGRISTIAFSPDGKHIVSGSDDRWIRVWDWKTTQQEKEQVLAWDNQASSVLTVAYSPDGKKIASGSTAISVNTEDSSKDINVRIWDAETGTELQQIQGHTGSVWSVAFSPDGKYLVSGSGERDKLEQIIRVWDVETGQLYKQLAGHTGSVFDVAFNPTNSNQIASGSEDYSIRLWNVEDEKQTWTQPGHTSSVSSVAFSPDGKQVASASDDQTVRIWDLETGETIQVLRGHTAWVSAIAFNPQNGNQIISSSFDEYGNDQTIRLWDVETGVELKKFTGHNKGILALAFNSEGTLIVSSSEDVKETIRIWDLETREVIAQTTDLRSPVRAVAFSPDNAQILSGDDNQRVQLWNWQTDEVKTFNGHKGGVTSVAFSNNGEQIISGSTDGTIIVWDVETGRVVRQLTNHKGEVLAVAFNPQNNNQIVSASKDNTARLWNLETGAEIQRFAGHTDWVRSVSFSPDGNYVVTGSKDQTTRVWNATSSLLSTLYIYEESESVTTLSDRIRSVAINPNGTQIVVSTDAIKQLNNNIPAKIQVWSVEGNENKPLREIKVEDATWIYALAFGTNKIAYSDKKIVQIWDINTSTEILSLDGPTKSVRSIAISPDEKRIAIGSQDQIIYVWDTTFGESLKKLKGHEGIVFALAFSADGEYLASGSSDQKACVWEIATSKEITCFKNHTGSVLTVAFSPNRQKVVSGGVDNILWIWDAETGQPLKQLAGHTRRINSVAFSKDGTQVISGGDDQQVRVWDVETGQEVRQLSGHTRRILLVAYPDEEHIMSVSDERDTRLWLADIDDLLNLAYCLIQRDPPIFIGNERNRFGLEFSPSQSTLTQLSKPNTQCSVPGVVIK